jgi:hypothetical protein
MRAALIRERRAWLAESVRSLLVPAASFVQEQIE